MSKLRIKISCNATENNDLVTSLRPNVSEIKAIKGGVIFDPISNEDGTSFEIPASVKSMNHIALIDITERGGKTDEQEYARVITGMSGKALRPYFIPRKTIKENGDHAYFSVPESCISVEVLNEIITIKEIRIENESDTKTNLKSIELYTGPVDNIPEEHIRFKQAALVAIDKSQCSKCTYTYYYVDTNVVKNDRQSTNYKKAA